MEIKKLKRLKPYKAIDPYTTIQNIRAILYDCGIFCTEHHNFYKSTPFKSCAVIMSNDGFEKFSISTNGKGMNFAFSLASAYAEFLERLQNGFLFFEINRYGYKEFLDNECVNINFVKRLENENLTFDFVHAPDEVRMCCEELSKSQKRELKHFLALKETEFELFLQLWKGVKLFWLPFYNANSETEVLLPIDFVNHSTNGLCAGNTKIEAINQGIGEIFERYAIKEIFTKQLTPPSIPNEFFEGTKVLEALNQLKSDHNFNFIIKDCSVGLGLPVIGLILIDYSLNKYLFTLGSDVSPITALERCLTESFQGRSSVIRNSIFTNINLNNHKFSDETKNSKILNRELEKKFRNGSGEWPNSIFGKTDSYLFNGFNSPITKSEEEDLQFLVNIIKANGWTLYIRDVGYLGFPSFRVSILELSDFLHYGKDTILNKNSELKRRVNNFFNIRTSYRITRSSSKELLEFAQNIETSNSNETKLFPYNIHPDRTLNSEILLAMLYYHMKDYEKSYKSIERLLLSPDFESFNDNFYYNCVKDYIFLKSKGNGNTEIINNLRIIYKDTVLNEVIEDFCNSDDIFRDHMLPNCFNCEECEIFDECKIIDVLRICKRLQEKYKDNIINQLDLKESIPSMKRVP